MQHRKRKVCMERVWISTIHCQELLRQRGESDNLNNTHAPAKHTQRVSHDIYPTFYFFFSSPMLCNLISAVGMWFSGLDPLQSNQ